MYETHVGAREGLWELAKEFRHALSLRSKKFGVPPLGFCLLAKPFLTLVTKSEPNKRTSELTLSNLGVAELQPTYAGLQMEELYFAASQNGIGARIGVMAVTVNARLCLTGLTLSSDTEYSGARFLADLKKRLVDNSHRSTLP